MALFPGSHAAAALSLRPDRLARHGCLPAGGAGDASRAGGDAGAGPADPQPLSAAARLRPAAVRAAVRPHRPAAGAAGRRSPVHPGLGRAGAGVLGDPVPGAAPGPGGRRRGHAGRHLRHGARRLCHTARGRGDLQPARLDAGLRAGLRAAARRRGRPRLRLARYLLAARRARRPGRASSLVALAGDAAGGWRRRAAAPCRRHPRQRAVLDLHAGLQRGDGRVLRLFLDRARGADSPRAGAGAAA